MKVEGMILDILKAFVKISYWGLIFNLQQCGISGNKVSLYDFLNDRKQGVVLNSKLLA